MMRNENKKMQMKTISSRCREWRKSKGYKLKDVARICDTVESNIFRFEHGRNDSYIVLMSYIALGMPVNDIFREENDKQVEE